MALLIALSAMAALTALAYRSIWGKNARYYYIGMPDSEELIYRDATRVIIKREDEQI